MRVKICGMTRIEDVRGAVDSGADALGFVVETPSSRRNLKLPEARRLMRSVPVFTYKVAVTSTLDPKTIQKICTELDPDALQMHAHKRKLVSLIRETHPGVELILTAQIRDSASIAHGRRISEYSDALLADTPNPAEMGGTGRVHDWKLTAALRREINPRPLILAGGLTTNNVRAAIRTVKPYAVDVSSGVEKKPGLKDQAKVRDFIIRAKEAGA